MATTNEQRECLALAGFVRVDGLMMVCPGDRRVTITPQPREHGRWEKHKGKVVLITNDSEMWLASDHWNQSVQRLVNVLTNRIDEGRVFVPCSNGEFIFTDQLLHRLADPDWMP